jgi:hypothetical protein
MIKKLLLYITRVISAGWCAECWLGGARLNYVVYCSIGGGSAIINYSLLKLR